MSNYQMGRTQNNIFEVQRKERVEQEELEFGFIKWLGYG